MRGCLFGWSDGMNGWLMGGMVGGGWGLARDWSVVLGFGVS